MSTLLHAILDRAPALATLAQECKGCPGTLCKGCHGTEQSWPACSKDAATFKPDSTYLSSERRRNRQFQGFFCWKCLVIAMSRYCSNSLPLAGAFCTDGRQSGN